MRVAFDGFKDHDVSPLGRLKALDELVDQHPVTHLQGRRHALGGDVVRVHDKRLYDPKDQGDADEELRQEIEGKRELLPLLLLLSGVAIGVRLFLRARRGGFLLGEWTYNTDIIVAGRPQDVVPNGP